jgi:two-component system, cell cycle response regulator
MRVVVAYGRAGERRRIRDVLAVAGYEVTECDRAGEALNCCLGTHPDVAVLDESVGGGVLEGIKGDANGFRTAVLLIAEDAPSVQQARDAVDRGVQDILVEPVRDGELLTRVSAAARTKGLQEEMIAQAERLETMLLEDPLTGLSTRRSILTQLAGMVSGARRHDRPLTIAIVDIDHFKAVNDTRGHAEGDRVLAAVARRLGGELRAEDQIGRLGGEEFLALLPDVDGDAADATTERLRASVEGLDVSVSIGWASWRGESAEELLRRADDALYTAKASGRDCVVGAPATVARRK